MLISLLICMVTCSWLSGALPTPEVPSGAAVAAGVERFYDDQLESYVDRIAEQIVNFNAHHADKHHHHQHAAHAKTHERGGKHEKHEKHPSHGHHSAKHYFPADDDEEMQSDQPQPGHQSQQALATSTYIDRQREQDGLSPEVRAKQAMRNSIKERVLLFVKKGNGTKSYGERDRSFYANCDQPKSTEENDDFMKLYFTLSQLEDTIASANLRLYRKTPNNQTFVDTSDGMPCLPPSAGGSRTENSAESEKLYRVTLYYHVKGQKKHNKLKKKIGDSRVITESMPYVNLNVLQGLRELNKGKLFGVLVQIEDQFGTVIKAGDFFKGPNCTVGMQNSQPIPTNFEEAYANLGRAAHPADLVRKPVQPKLDVKTIQAPPLDEDAADFAMGAATPQAATPCRHVQLRHARGHHHQQQQQQQQPQNARLPGDHVIVSRPGSLNYDDLLDLLDRDKQLRLKQQMQHFDTT